MDIRGLQQQAHANAVAKGFHDVDIDAGTLDAIDWLGVSLSVVTDAVERLRRHQSPSNAISWMRRHVMGTPAVCKPHDRRPSVRRLILVATEVTEAIRAIGTPEYASELADIVIRVADTAAADGVDLQAAVEEKMQQNATRPRMHGGKAF